MADKLTLADGTVLDTKTRKVSSAVSDRRSMVEVPTSAQAVEQVIAARRRLHDLPALPKQTNILAAILGYKLFGLSNFDIATALNITESQVDHAIESTVYKELSEKVFEAIAEHDSHEVRGYFKRTARKAATQLTTFMNSENESIALAATKDILDRAGFSPAHVVQHEVSGGLEIRLVKRDDTKIIEGTFNGDG